MSSFTVSYSDVAGFPAGSVVDHVVVTATEAAGASLTQSVAPGTASVTFDLTPGTWDISAQGFPAVGAGFGKPAVLSGFVVAVPVTVTLSLPSAIVGA